MAAAGLSTILDRPALTDPAYKGVDVELLVGLAVFWFVASYGGKLIFNAILSFLFSATSVYTARLPGSFPFQDDPKDNTEWPKLVVDVDEKALDEALVFFSSKTYQEESPSFQTVSASYAGKTPSSLTDKQRLVADHSLHYHKSLYDSKAAEYYYNKFGLQKEWPYPAMRWGWNKWGGWYGELGPATRGIYTGVIMYAIEHGFVVLSMAYYRFVSPSLAVFRFAVYCDAGFNIVDALAMGLSLVYKKMDLTIYCGVRSVSARGASRDSLIENSGIWRLLGLHHLGAFGMEVMGLYLNADPAFGSRIALALIGSGFAHCVCILLDYTPVRENYLLWAAINGSTFLIMLWFRGLAWLPMMYESLLLANDYGGYAAAGFTLLALLLFSLFNIDFIKFYLSKTKMAYQLLTTSTETKKKKN